MKITFHMVHRMPVGHYRSAMLRIVFFLSLFLRNAFFGHCWTLNHMICWYCMSAESSIHCSISHVSHAIAGITRRKKNQQTHTNHFHRVYPKRNRETKCNSNFFSSEVKMILFRNTSKNECIWQCRLLLLHVS